MGLVSLNQLFVILIHVPYNDDKGPKDEKGNGAKDAAESDEVFIHVSVKIMGISYKVLNVAEKLIRCKA